MLLGSNTHTLVTNTDLPEPVVPLRFDPDLRRLRTCILDRVADQVLEPIELPLPHERAPSAAGLCGSLRKRFGLRSRGSRAHNKSAVAVDILLPAEIARSCARIVEQCLDHLLHPLRALVEKDEADKFIRILVRACPYSAGATVPNSRHTAEGAPAGREMRHKRTASSLHWRLPAPGSHPVVAIR